MSWGGLYSISLRFCRFKCHIGSFIKVNCDREKNAHTLERARQCDSKAKPMKWSNNPSLDCFGRIVHVERQWPVCVPEAGRHVFYQGFDAVLPRRILIASIESKQHLFNVHHCSNVTHLHCIISWIKDVFMSDVLVYLCMRQLFIIDVVVIAISSVFFFPLLLLLHRFVLSILNNSKKCWWYKQTDHPNEIKSMEESLSTITLTCVL